jgi:hypothetical protein
MQARVHRGDVIVNVIGCVVLDGDEGVQELT